MKHLICLIGILSAFACSAPSDRTDNDSSRTERLFLDPPAPLAEDAAYLKFQLETGLTPSVRFEDDPIQVFELRNRMARYGAPAVSMAYAKQGQLVWADAYGDDVSVETRFQAASLSKVVAATGITAYALDNGLSLDADVASFLPEINFGAIGAEDSVISLRGLLSHTSGATVGGFEGYPIGVPIPSNLDVIRGSEHTNSDPIVFEQLPDNAFRYSGGGFQIAQAVVESHSGKRFDVLMSEHVFSPLGMATSSFAIELPGGLTRRNALGHDATGLPTPGGWRVYPEQAAAGLWTTPRDFARFVSALISTQADGEHVLIAEAVKSEVLTAVSPSYGLGIRVLEADGRIMYRHKGANFGYRSEFIAFPDTQEVFVIMTNSDNGERLSAEIMRSAARAYEWPIAGPKQVKRARIPQAHLNTFAGAYALPGSTEPHLFITVGDGILEGELDDGRLFELVPLSRERFIDPADGAEVSFKTEQGQMQLMAGRAPLSRIEPN